MDASQLTRLYRDHLADLDRRYAPVLAEAGFDAVVIHSGSLKKRSEFDDQYWPLRAVPHFQHWVPLNVADCALVIEPGVKRTLYWLTAQSYWERPPALESDHFEGQWEVVRIAAPEDVKAHLPTGKRLAFIGEDKARAESWGLELDTHNPFDLVGRLDRLRVFKTPYEVLCLAEANRRAALGHDAVVKAFKHGAHSELELHLAYLAATGQDDPETPYKNIVALGKNGATLHHISYEKRALDKTAESLLLDAGATCLGYCSDITRTWWKGTGATASAFGHMVDLTERMQMHLCEAVKIGLPYEELHEQAHRDVAGILQQIGVFTCSTDEAVEHKLSRSFFPHGLGHSLGLQCHDVGCALVKPRPENPYLRNTSIIEPGQCFTIEPGIYFIDFLMDELRQGEHGKLVNWPLVDSLAELGGVRIEDDLVVTDDGTVHRNLTRELLPIGGGEA
jgi:Xaa-Pro dipeptidase